MAAVIVCQQFGLQFLAYLSNTPPGPAGGRVWLENVQCNGNEQSIFNCAHNGWGNTNCQHEEDIGIICTSMELKLYSYVHTVIIVP